MIASKAFQLGFISFCFPFGILCAGHGEMDFSQLDQRLEALKKELHHNQVIEMNEEIESQGLMIADWDKYSQKMEEVQKKEEYNRYLIEEIKRLERKKAQIINRESDAG